MRIINTFFCCMVACVAFSQPGTLDSSFGENGKVITSFNNDYTLCFSAVLQKDNKIITVGQGNKNIGNQTIAGFLLVRYNSDGSKDNSFGDSGRVITSFDSGLAEAHAVKLQSDGKIVAVGFGGINGSLSNNDIFLVRYDTKGNIDSTFGSNGKVRTDFGRNESGLNIAIQDDDKIVVCGYSLSDFLIARYLPDGNLDASFGGSGFVQTSFTSGIAKALSVVIQHDGKILTAGTAGNKAAFARYLTNGKLDEGFGNSGTFTSTFNVSYSVVSSIALTEDGSFVAAGEAGTGFTGDMLVAKFKQDGSPDLEFGSNGKTIISYERTDSRVKSAALQTDGKILLIGDTYSSFNSTKGNFAVCRLLGNGILDESFGTSGKTVTDFGNEYDESTACGFLDNQQRIVAVGYPNNFSYPAGYVILLARYNNDITPPPTPIARIKRWLRKHGITWEDCPPSICNNITGYAVQRSPNGINWSTVFRSPLTAHRSLPTNSYADPSPLPGTNYYRLQTTSVDGAVAYSNVIAINNELSVISISPNPARSVLRIDGLPSNQKIKITIVDIAGNVAMNYAPLAIRPSPLNISSLKPGNYLLRVETDGQVVTKQFVKE